MTENRVTADLQSDKRVEELEKVVDRLYKRLVRLDKEAALSLAFLDSTLELRKIWCASVIKVFYWDEVRRLAEYGDGYAIGIGDTRGSVVDAIVSAALPLESHESKIRKTLWGDSLRYELLSTEPKVFNSFPAGIAIPGSS